MALVERLIDISFKLATGNFTESGSDVVTVSGLRTTAQIAKAGTTAMQAHLRIYGMTLSLMNKLSTLGVQINLLARNTVTISAGDADTGMGIIFVGTVTMAWIDFQGMPEVAFDVSAQAGAAEAVIPTPPASFNGAADVVTIMSGLAAKMQLTFENSGVSGQLSNPYLPGSLVDQARACAEAGGFMWAIDNGKLAIWPRNGSRGGAIPLVSPATGMIGYPTYTAVGIMLRTLFNKSINFGGQIQVDSSLAPAKGTWAIYAIDHELESMMPNGAWFSTIGAYNPKSPQPVLAQ
jgi:hypothetical protein